MPTTSPQPRRTAQRAGDPPSGRDVAQRGGGTPRKGRFRCLGCGVDKRVATAEKDEQGLPRRCVDCVAHDEDVDRFVAIACHIAEVDPALPAPAVTAAISEAAPSSRERAVLAENLGFFPGSLTSGASSATRVAWRLVVALQRAGATTVVRPRCADCGQPRELVSEPAWSQRICAICHRQRAARPCWRCGQVATVHRRTADGAPLCRNCWNRDPESWQTCSRCHEHRRINARGSDGEPICARCYHDLRPTERCEDCGRDRRIVTRHGGQRRCAACYRHVQPRRRCGGCQRTRPISRRGGDGQPDLCAACNWAPTAVCSRCGDQTMCRHAANSGPPVCLRCLATQQLDELLTGPDGSIAPAFDSLRAVFVAAHQPRSLLTWLHRSPGAVLLARLAAGDVDLDHAALDRLPQTAALHHLRQLLVACGALPERDPYVAAVDQAIGRYETTLRQAAHRALRLFGTWHELARLRRHWPAGDTPPLAVKTAQGRLLAATGLLRQLEADGIALAELTQATLDGWVAQGASTRLEVRSFILFTTRRGLAPAGLEVPVRRPQATPAPLDDATRWQLARRLLHDDTIDPADRVVGSLILLYAQPVARIARLTLDDIDDRDGDLTITFGKDRVVMPEPLAGLLRQLPWRRQIGPSGIAADTHRWLFPGRQAGRHLHPDYVRNRMLTLGVPPRASRHAALAQLAREVPAAVLADMLNIDAATATAWAARSGAPWSTYAAQRVAARPASANPASARP